MPRSAPRTSGLLALLALFACGFARCEEPAPVAPVPAPEEETSPLKTPDEAQAPGKPNDAAMALKTDLEQLTGGVFTVHSQGVTAVVSDAPDAFPQAALKHLHQVLPLMRALACFPQDAPVPAQVRVALFRNPEDFAKFLAARGAPPGGAYAYLHDPEPSRRVCAAFILAANPMLPRLRHVAFEKMLRAWIEHPPAWLRIGLGECMEHLALDPEGRPKFSYGRDNARDLREHVLQANPSPPIPFKELTGMESAAFSAKGLPAAIEAWSFVRFLADDPLPREARLLQKLLHAMDSRADEAKNARYAQEFFVEDEWPSIERAWRRYAEGIPETPAEDVYERAMALVEKRDYAAAVPLLEQAAAADPNYARLHYYLALCRFHLGDTGQVLPAVAQALQLFPEYHAARFLRAQARARLGDRAGARKDFEMCLATPYKEKAEAEIAKLGE